MHLFVLKLPRKCKDKGRATIRLQTARELTEKIYFLFFLWDGWETTGVCSLVSGGARQTSAAASHCHNAA